MIRDDTVQIIRDGAPNKMLPVDFVRPYGYIIDAYLQLTRSRPRVG